MNNTKIIFDTGGIPVYDRDSTHFVCDTSGDEILQVDSGKRIVIPLFPVTVMPGAIPLARPGSRLQAILKSHIIALIKAAHRKGIQVNQIRVFHQDLTVRLLGLDCLITLQGGLDAFYTPEPWGAPINPWWDQEHPQRSFQENNPAHEIREQILSNLLSNPRNMA
jgi:hypothetical protein